MPHTNTLEPCKFSNQKKDQNAAKRVLKSIFPLISQDFFVCLFLSMPFMEIITDFGKNKTRFKSYLDIIIATKISKSKSKCKSMTCISFLAKLESEMLPKIH